MLIFLVNLFCFIIMLAWISVMLIGVYIICAIADLHIALKIISSVYIMISIIGAVVWFLDSIKSMKEKIKKHR